MSHRALIAVAALLVAGEARAEWEAAYGYGANLETVGGDGYTGGVLHINLSKHVMPRLALSVTAELASVSSDDIMGGIARGMAGIDIDLLEPSDRDFSPRVLASVGTGTESIMWDRGTLTRSMSYVGIETRLGFRFDHSGNFRHISSLGFRFGVRGLIAPGATTDDIVERCSACDAMAKSKSVDVGLAIYMGLVFGR